MSLRFPVTTMLSGAPGTRTSRWTVAAIAVLALGQVGCQSRADATEKPKELRSAAIDTAVPEVLAAIGDEKVTMTDIHGRAGDQLDQLDLQYRRARDKIIG